MKKKVYLDEERKRIRDWVTSHFARVNIRVGLAEYPMYIFSVLELDEMLNPQPLPKKGRK